MNRQLLIVVAASSAFALPRVVLPQQPSPGTIVVGVLALQGTQGEAGVGLSAAFRRPVGGGRLAVEFGAHIMADIPGPCLLTPAGSLGCSFNDPASPSFYARLTGRSGNGWAYLTAGIGAYAPVGLQRSERLAAGADAGGGLRLSRRAALEARFVALQGDRWLGWVIPLGVAITL